MSIPNARSDFLSGFDSRHSDQKSVKIVDFGGFLHSKSHFL